VITPVTEEFSKSAFLLWLLISRRFLLRTILDGIVYGGLIGAGFAFSEQVMYFGQIVVRYLASNQTSEAANTILIKSFLLRGLLVPFMHSFFVSFTGVAVATAARRNCRSMKGVVLVIGFLAPISLHGIWDWAGLSSRDPFMIVRIYAYVMFPLFFAMTTSTLILRHRAR
jgi:RsiW-degrading membrane proteinase PrsW (M82 family)